MIESNATTSATLTRRALLSGVSAVSVLSLTQIPGRAFAANLDVDAFIALSQKLVGRDDLDEEIAAVMIKAFAAAGRKDDLSELAEGASDDALAVEIVAAWYTGESPDPEDPEVLTYTEALIWKAMDYTKPLTFCGGGVGYWGTAPEA